MYAIKYSNIKHSCSHISPGNFLTKTVWKIMYLFYYTGDGGRGFESLKIFISFNEIKVIIAWDALEFMRY